MNLAGKKFNKLTVLSLANKEQLYTRGVRNGYKYSWLCQCDCGNKTVVSQCHLISGHTQSCGCHQRDVVSTQRKLSSSRLHGVWRNMMGRCYDRKHRGFKNYGGRGITVCDEWKNSFLAFNDWAFANGYDEKAKKMGCSLDRIDNDKGYSPENCRWVNQTVQSRNNRSNINITINGKTQCVAAWCEELGVSVPRVFGYRKNHNATYEESLYVLTHKRWDKSAMAWVDK